MSQAFEESVDIPGFPGYKITATGSIWSSISNRWLIPDPHAQGYFRVVLTVNKKGHRFLVHRLIALAWIGPPPFDGAKVLHKDDDRSNNHYSNLYYGTQSNNMKDAVRNGKNTHIFSIYGTSVGSKNGNSRLNESQVSEIKMRLRGGESPYRIHGDYAVCVASIENIRVGKTWRHVN